MAVRRLAEANVQPAEFKFNPANLRWAKNTIKKYPRGRQASAVIPLLMRAQDQDGWVTKASIESIAEMLDMPLIRVLEVATFYTQFQLQPVGTKAHVQVCGTTPCMLRGSHDLMKVCKRKISEKQFETNAEGTLSWEEVECQGACVNAPMVMIFHDTYEDLSAERLEEIIDAFEADKGDTVKPGPQIDRVFSSPVDGATALLEDPVVKKNVRIGKSGGANGKSAASAAASSTAKAKSGGGRKAADAAKTAATAKKAASIAKGKGPAKSKSPAKDAGTSQALGIASLSDKNRPPQVGKPAKPDDLKLISGVGPKLEGVLNDLGIYTFAQIGKWKKAEVEWVDGYLRFKGRIDRDDWIKQAKALAKGGEAEYIKVFGKKPR